MAVEEEEEGETHERNKEKQKRERQVVLHAFLVFSLYVVRWGGTYIGKELKTVRFLLEKDLHGLGASYKYILYEIIY